VSHSVIDAVICDRGVIAIAAAAYGRDRSHAWRAGRAAHGASEVHRKATDRWIPGATWRRIRGCPHCRRGRANDLVWWRAAPACGTRSPCTAERYRRCGRPGAGPPRRAWDGDSAALGRTAACASALARGCRAPVHLQRDAALVESHAQSDAVVGDECNLPRW